jgi:hypothetical protein
MSSEAAPKIVVYDRDPERLHRMAESVAGDVQVNLVKAGSLEEAVRAVREDDVEIVVMTERHKYAVDSLLAEDPGLDIVFFEHLRTPRAA